MCHEGTQFLLCTFLFIFFNNLYFYFWLCWVFMAEHGLSPVVESGGHSPAAAHKTLTMERRLNCPMKCGIFLDQGLNRVPCIGRQILNPWTTREVLHSPSWVSHSGGSQSPCCVATQAASWKGPWRKELRHQPCEGVTWGRNPPTSVELSEDCSCTSPLGWIFMWDPELTAQLS